MRTKQLASSGPSRMSPREQQVFELMLTGAPCKVMAQDLGLSHRTVEVHRAHILRIMGATTTNEVIRMWYEAQLAARDEQIAALTARLAGPRTLSVRDMFNEEETRLAKVAGFTA